LKRAGVVGSLEHQRWRAGKRGDNSHRDVGLLDVAGADPEWFAHCRFPSQKNEAARKRPRSVSCLALPRDVATVRVPEAGKATASRSVVKTGSPPIGTLQIVVSHRLRTATSDSLNNMPHAVTAAAAATSFAAS